MTPTRLAEIRRLLGWSLDTLSERSDIRYSTVLRWSNGAQVVPPAIAQWLEGLAADTEAMLAKHPLPPKQDTGKGE